MTLTQFLEQARAQAEGFRKARGKATPGLMEVVYPNQDEGDVRVQTYHADKRSVVHDGDALAWKVKPEDAEFFSLAANQGTWLAETVLRLAEMVQKLEEAGFYHGIICSVCSVAVRSGKPHDEKCWYGNALAEAQRIARGEG